MAKSFQEFTRSILETLRELDIPYAIGGSVASSTTGAFCTTNDIDISIKMDLAGSEKFIIHKLKYFTEGRMPKHPRDILAMLETHKNTIDLDYISYWAKETGVEPVWTELLEEYHRRLSEIK